MKSGDLVKYKDCPGLQGFENLTGVVLRVDECHPEVVHVMWSGYLAPEGLPVFQRSQECMPEHTQFLEVISESR